MSLVSVIIPYYKKKLFIEETVNSAIYQSYKNLEIIIIYDDSCTDDLNYIDNLKKKDERIRVLVNPKTLGAGFSRNVGILSAKGEYIAFLDADDVWKKNKLEDQIKFMKENHSSCSHTSYEIIDKNNKIKGFRIAKKFINYEELLKSCDIGLSTVIIKREIFTKECQFPNLKTKEDFVLWLKILKKQIIFNAIDKKFTSWRDLEESLSSSVIQKIKDGFRVYNTYMNFNFFKSSFLLICLCLNYIKKNK